MLGSFYLVVRIYQKKPLSLDQGFRIFTSMMILVVLPILLEVLVLLYVELVVVEDLVRQKFDRRDPFPMLYRCGLPARAFIVYLCFNWDHPYGESHKS